MPFLTDLDERAQVKGSRDPLGLVPIWAKLGRAVVGNLTTVTGSVRGFTTLLIGLELADMLREELRGEAPGLLPTFLKFEQIAAYARLKSEGDVDVRGYRRVRRRLDEQRRIRVSADQPDQILSNQKVYGLWGLFSVPARASELLEPGTQRLTPAAREFVHGHYFPILGNGRGARPVLDLLRRESFELKSEGRHADLLERLGRIHSRRLRADERRFYRDSLAYGGTVDSTGGRQRALAEILEEIDVRGFAFPEFRAVQKKARANDSLSASLEQIERLERLIAPAAVLFGFLQNRDGQLAETVSGEIAKTWRRPLRVDPAGLREIQPAITAALQSKEDSELWMMLAEALATGDYGAVVERLVAINAAVMRRRNGAAAWIAIESNRIRVRLADERADLVGVEEAEEYWKSTYFINSLWRVAREVRG